MAENQCERKGKFFGGCKFEPRFSEELAKVSFNLNPIFTSAEVLLREMKMRKYQGDVCTRCGLAVNTPPATVVNVTNNNHG